MNHSKSWTEIENSAAWRRNSAFWELVRAVSRSIGTFYRRSMQRRQLVNLSDHQLRDLGLTRVDVEMEWQKSFWRR